MDVNPSHETGDVQTVNDRDTSDSDNDSRPPIPNFATFPGQSFSDIRRDIAILTQILKGYQHGLSASAKSPNRALQFWSLLSCILNTGSFDDLTGAKVIAVTGQVFADEIRTAIFARNTSNCAPRSGSHNAPELAVEPAVGIVPILPKGENAASSLLDSCMETELAANFQGHLQDIVTLIDHISAPPPPSPDCDAILLDRMYTMLYFVLRRTYLQLCARLLNRRKIWSECPIVLMQNWYEENRPTFGNTSVRVAVDSALYLHTLLPKQGIFPLQDSDSNYPVTVNNAKLWLNAFSVLIAVMEEQLSEEVQPKKTKPTRKVRSKPPANVVDLALVVMALDALLNSKVLDIIITPPLAAHIDNEYQGTKQPDSGQNTESPGTRQDAESLQAAESSVSLDEAGQEDAVDREPDDDKEAVENPRQHVVRYLKTLTTQYNAVRNLVYRGSGTPPSKLVTYMFNITPPVLNVDDADISGFKTKFLEMFAHPGSQDYLASDAFLATINRRADDVRGKTAVHAEASLMGLACASVFHFEPHLEEDKLKLAVTVFAMDSAEAIPIGVSEKCCLCCSMLADLLAKRSTETTARPRFVLPGTHATIFPWAAPSIGVPLDVLKDMRTQLLQVLYEIAISTKNLPRSHQTYPALSTSSLPRVARAEHAMMVDAYRKKLASRS